MDNRYNEQPANTNQQASWIEEDLEAKLNSSNDNRILLVDDHLAANM